MARLSPSSNNTTDLRSQQGDQDNNDDDVHDHDRNGSPQRPDDIDVDVSLAAPPAQQSPVSTSSEGYPSWLPKRPPPPAPGSTLHSLSTHMVFGSDAAGPAAEPLPGGRTSDDRPHAHAHAHVQTPVPFSGGRKPTPRSVRIVSMQDSNAAASGAGSGARRDPTDRTTTRVSSTAAAAPPSPTTPRFPSFPFLPFLFRPRAWS